jgi:hypothetical protein
MHVASILKFMHDSVLSVEDSVQVAHECAPGSLVLEHFFANLVTDGSKHY